MPVSSSLTVRAVALLGVVLLMRAGPVAAQETPEKPMMQCGMAVMQPGQSALIRTLLPTVVNITIRRDVPRSDNGMNAAGGATETRRFFGSGFVIDSTGVIATNYHVVADAWQIDVTFSDGTRVPGHLLRGTHLIDIALVKVDVGHPLPVVHWGDSEQLQIGDPVFAIGNALGVGISVSGGLVSALNRDIMDSPYDDFIQTDAALNHGNSGGPLFDKKGDVVGIDSALISLTDASSGLGFAIPAHTAQIVIRRLMEYGWLRPGWIGVKIQGVNPDMALALGMTQPEGAIVANVAPDGPAAAAGLRVGDVILHLGTSTPSDERALLRAIANAPIGQDITLGLWRDGREQQLDVTVREWPRSQWDAIDVPVSMAVSHHQVPPDLGITLGTLDDAGRARFGLPATTPSGTLVTEVMAGTDADQRGIVPGDVILRVQEKTVTTVAETQAAFAAARAQNRPFVLALIEPKVHHKPGPEWIALRVADD